MFDIKRSRIHSAFDSMADAYWHTTDRKKSTVYHRDWCKWACVFLAGIAMPCSAIDLMYGYQVIVPPRSVTLTDSSTTNQNITPGWQALDATVMKRSMNRGVLGNVHVLPPGQFGDDWCRLGAFPYVTLDGYKGYQVSTGVLVIPFGSMSANWGLSPMTVSGSIYAPTFTRSGTAISGTVSGSWGEKGNRTSGTAPTEPGCGVALSYQGTIPAGPAWEIYPNGATGIQLGLTTSTNIGYGVYVSPTAPPFRATVDARIHRGENSTNSFAADIVTTLDLNLAAASCTVETPSVVDFGNIAASDGQNPATVESQISVNCTGRTGTSLPVTYSVTPKSGAGTKNTIPMKSAAGGVAGDIRGFLGQTASADAGCTDKPSSVAMNGSASSWGNVTVGTRDSKPLAWTLCPRPDANPGPATATATLEVTW
ncbi:TPA: spore coat protein U domain-containing protein [Klebsiella pneumoniae]|uniref:spore coat protein U domain-containing protein n=1 Tax=Klebsiella pneumoniae TaxID=573 RepID=UPI000E2CC1EF|nr:spore coat protein U domain-containing protein [Klebsiella pneumoniae]MBE4995658.1 spore coat protein U domain-containing protein [Klebsiella pneumoniae]MEB7562135.1 spore coat protein U domain-containing protein [Klebsiella pneumoniae]MEB7701525.1 spore coat protein U domain-containing protein [Klebsiella pneumoniae]SYU52284.1 Uncharacterised protein [Klebsiella pneumoniae]HBR4144148.1 spore coat protein U domain-containing protein [Klebsiella pneumoniae]